MTRTAKTPEHKQRAAAFGSLLRQARHDSGDTLDEIAARLGVGKAHLSHVERGKRSPPACDIGEWLNAYRVEFGAVCLWLWPEV